MTSINYLSNTRPVVLALACLVAILLGACAPVKPWQRGNLAQAHMSLNEDPMLSSISAHIYDSKEASSGGIGPAGGGCGCN